jgi:hypothetical protein
MYGVIGRLAMLASSYELEATDPDAEPTTDVGLVNATRRVSVAALQHVATIKRIGASCLHGCWKRKIAVPNEMESVPSEGGVNLCQHPNRHYLR